MRICKYCFHRRTLETFSWDTASPNKIWLSTFVSGFQDLLAREISWFDLLWSIVKALNLRLLHNKSICLVKQQWNFSGFLAGCNKFPIIIQTQKNSRLVRLTQELHVPFHKDHCCTSNSRKFHEENPCYFRGVYIISMTAHNSRELLKIIENTHSFVLTSEMFFFLPSCSSLISFFHPESKTSLIIVGCTSDFKEG